MWQCYVYAQNTMCISVGKITSGQHYFITFCSNGLYISNATSSIFIQREDCFIFTIKEPTTFAVVSHGAFKTFSLSSNGFDLKLIRNGDKDYSMITTGTFCITDKSTVHFVG